MKFVVLEILFKGKYNIWRKKWICIENNMGNALKISICVIG